MQGFKKFGGEEIQDLGLYVRNYMLDHENVVLSVGCDSDEHKRQDLYASAVCFYHIGCGGHIVFKREWVPKKNVGRKISRVEERLWEEVERSKAVADYLESILSDVIRRKTTSELVSEGYDPTQNKLVEVHVDFNPNPTTPVKASKKKKTMKRSTTNRSNTLHAAAVGYLVGFGYRVKTKPDAWAASCAADLMVREK